MRLRSMGASVRTNNTESPSPRVAAGNKATRREIDQRLALNYFAPPISRASKRSVRFRLKPHSQSLWDLKEPVKTIDTAAFDVVALQEDIPETTVADFREYAAKFVAEVQKNHARPVVFVAWNYPRRGWISMAKIARAHRDAAKELNVEVAPIGRAWQQALKQRPG